MQLRWHVEIRTSLQVNKVKSSDRKQESRVESMSDLESELRKMQPASAEQSQAELMYRCGWEAALAQQEAESEVLAPSVSTADPADSQKQAFSFCQLWQWCSFRRSSLFITYAKCRAVERGASSLMSLGQSSWESSSSFKDRSTASSAKNRSGRISDHPRYRRVAVRGLDARVCCRHSVHHCSVRFARADFAGQQGRGRLIG